MMLYKAKCTRFYECFCKLQVLVFFLLPASVGVTLLLITRNEAQVEEFPYPIIKFDNKTNVSLEAVNGFLVWNPKCHMESKNPLDPSITKFVKPQKYQACSSTPALTATTRVNGSMYLVVNQQAAKSYKQLSCCWAPVVRPVVKNYSDKHFDSKITVGQCEKFSDRVLLPDNVDVLTVSCTASKSSKSIYKNVHGVLNPKKIQDRLNVTENGVDITPVPEHPRKLSVLLLGLDSVSRLNFHRSMPKTNKFLQDNGWLELNGYNKMGDNTFPNLMAILTGQNQSWAYQKCTPTIPGGLDKCPFLWYNFRNAGYVTAYGEDEVVLSTFNYNKVGFENPPTDYYLRPYMVASEKLLNSRQRFHGHYCTGPEVSAERVLNFAFQFAKTFIGIPYFGFFWTNTVSHGSVNGPSSMDEKILINFEQLEQEGVMNDTMIIFLSDHGMRYGGIRDTIVGWYEERLPFIRIWLPEWFREENPHAYHSLKVNQNRLTSPYDLYETLRDILLRAGGDAIASSGCSTCKTLFLPASHIRGCENAGVTSHWCTCAAFHTSNSHSKIALDGADKFVEHIENVAKNYKSDNGKRLCSKSKLKKIHRVDQILKFEGDVDEYFYMVEVSPGNRKYEATVRYYGPGNYSINDEEVSTLDSYAVSAKCLNQGMKQYCYCVK